MLPHISVEDLSSWSVGKPRISSKLNNLFYIF